MSPKGDAEDFPSVDVSQSDERNKPSACLSLLLVGATSFFTAGTHLTARARGGAATSAGIRMQGSGGAISPSNVIDFLSVCGKLKRTVRTGWKLTGIEDCESVADHSWRMGLLAMMLPEGLDRQRCIKMALVHDLAEALVGDITPHDGISKEEKSRRETEAMHEIRKASGDSDIGVEIEILWNEYEAASSPEAKALKDLDKFEMILQAEEYEQSHGKDLQQFFDSTQGKIRLPEVQTWEKELRERRQKRMSGGGGA